MNGNTLSTSEIKKRLKKISPDIKILGEYEHCMLPIRCKCLKCHRVWWPKWQSISQGSGCPNCAKLSTSEIKKRLKKINPSIKIIGKFVRTKDPIKCKCLNCENIWSPTWANLSQGSGCPKCNDVKLSTSEIKARLEKINSSIKVSGEYKHSQLLLKIRCLVCSYKWNATWANLSQGSGCPKCGCDRQANSLRLTTKQVKKRLKKINSSIKIIGKYESVFSPLKCKCLKCKNMWSPVWANLSQCTGCPNCRSGKSEEEVRKIIEELTGKKFPKANPSDVPFLHGLHLDGYSPNLRSKKYPLGTAFEFQDYSHYGPSHYTKFSKKDFIELKRRDWRKKIQCWRHGVRLICIPYKIKNIESYLADRLTR